MVNEFPIAGSATGLMYVMAILPAVILGVLLYAAYAVNNISFKVSDSQLTIDAAIYGRSINRSAIDMDGVRVMTPGEVDTRFLPKKRTNGFGLHSRKLGWFQLNSGEKALLAVSPGESLVYLPTREGYALLVSPKEPDAFVAALRR